MEVEAVLVFAIFSVYLGFFLIAFCTTVCQSRYRRLRRLRRRYRCCWEKPVIVNVSKPVGTPTHPAVISSLRNLNVRPACNSGTNEIQGERHSALTSGALGSQTQPQAITYHRRYPSRERLPFIIHTPDGLPAASRTRQWPLHEHTSSNSQSTSRQLGRANARRNANTSISNRDYWSPGGDQSGDRRGDLSGDRRGDLITGDRSGDRSRDESGHRIRGRREYNVYSHLLASTVVQPSNEAMDHRSPAYRLTGTRHHSLRDERVRRGYNVNSGIDVAQNHHSQTLSYLMTGTSAPPPWGSPNRSLEPDLPPRYEDAIPPSYAEAISKLEYVVPTYI